jgi:Spy/CpxP family protein refolding chaperone
MLKQVCALIVAGVMVCGIGVAFAQAEAQEERRGLWWRSAELAHELQLTEDEIEQLEQFFEASRLKMTELKNGVESEQVKLQTLLERRDFDEAAVMAQHERLENARSKLARERFAFFVEVRKIVGHERFLQLLQIREAKARERRRR